MAQRGRGRGRGRGAAAWEALAARTEAAERAAELERAARGVGRGRGAALVPAAGVVAVGAGHGAGPGAAAAAAGGGAAGDVGPAGAAAVAAGPGAGDVGPGAAALVAGDVGPGAADVAAGLVAGDGGPGAADVAPGHGRAGLVAVPVAAGRGRGGGARAAAATGNGVGRLQPNANHSANPKMAPRQYGVDAKLQVFSADEYLTGDSERDDLYIRLASLYNSFGDKFVSMSEKSAHGKASRNGKLKYMKDKDHLMLQIRAIHLTLQSHNAKAYPFPKIFSKDPF